MYSILVVEDDKFQRRVIADILRKEGYAVIEAGSGEEVDVRLKDGKRPDLVLLDVRLPGENGFSICRRLRAHAITWALPIIMITTSDREADVVKAFDAGADDYQQKPLKPVELLARIRGHLRPRNFRKSRTFYELLTLGSDCEDKELKRAYHDAVRKCHPDSVSHLDEDIQEFALEKMKRVNEAYDVLKDPKKRKIYDECLRKGTSFVEALTDYYEDQARAAAKKKASRDAAATPQEPVKPAVDPMVFKYMAQCSVKILEAGIRETFKNVRWHSREDDQFFDQVITGQSGIEKCYLFIRAYPELTVADMQVCIDAVADYCVNPARRTIEKDYFVTIFSAARLPERDAVFSLIRRFNAENGQRGPREDMFAFSVVDITNNQVRMPFHELVKPDLTQLRLNFK